MKQPEGQGKANRLARETSPYLLQHAHNPVDWYPWGPEAFAEARRRDVPIFLSIGYSTCYWCHVMERESFEDGATARVMNERFVCVKVDREERPDVDDIYMAAVQITTGRGGWPMSVFLEPEKLRPFWCGTYFPPRPGNGMPSFTQVLEAIGAAWKEKRADIVAQSELIAGAVRENLAAAGEPVGVGAEQVTSAVSALLTSHDRVRGGFSAAPKFPQPVYLELLLGFLPMAGDEPTRGAVEQALRRTLDRMAIGGMNDQIGGGFHRYSVDAEWLVPHFEKMLYDNAQLASLYARASRAFDDPFYARTARRTLGYVLREMTLPEGGFFSAQDAEVDGREGKNYLWTPDEVRAALGPADAALALRVYGLDGGTNFRDPHHPEEPPSNVLRLDDRPEVVAAAEKMEPAAFLAALDRINEKLYAARAERKQPRLDDKVLSGWNGLMIGAMASGGAALGEAAFVRAAARSADFVLGTMRDGDGGLLRSFRDGKARIAAFLEDYAFMIHGLIELHRAGGDGRTPYLDAAIGLAGAAEERFGDGSGGYFDTLAGREDLFVRTRSTYDGAIPCGSSVMLNNLVDLFEVQGERAHFGAATGCLASLSAAVARSPVATANATRGLMRMLARDAGAVAAALPAAGPVGGPAVPAGVTPVVVFSSEERVTVSRDTPAALSLRIRIAEGYHINAADPGPGGGGLIPLRVGVTGGTGVRVYADYPKGEPYGEGGEIRIHKGEFEFEVVLEREGEWSGRPMLVVTWQVCTDTECLAPTTVELDVAIDRGD